VTSAGDEWVREAITTRDLDRIQPNMAVAAIA
jgi:hypothetical protein